MESQDIRVALLTHSPPKIDLIVQSAVRSRLRNGTLGLFTINFNRPLEDLLLPLYRRPPATDVMSAIDDGQVLLPTVVEQVWHNFVTHFHKRVSRLSGYIAHSVTKPTKIMQTCKASSQAKLELELELEPICLSLPPAVSDNELMALIDRWGTGGDVGLASLALLTAHMLFLEQRDVESSQGASQADSAMLHR